MSRELSIDQQLIHDLERLRLRVIRLESAESAQREKAEEAVRERDAFQRVMDALPAPVWRAGADGLVFYGNRQCARFGMRPGEEGALPVKWAAGIHPDDYIACMAAYDDAVREEQSFTLEYRRKRNDGVFSRVRDCGGPLYDITGRLAGYIGAFFELSGSE